MNAQEEVLNVLRDAQNLSDWPMCREKLASLATELGQDDIANIIFSQARQFLLLYLEDSPEDKTIIEAISNLANTKALASLSGNTSIIRSILQSKVGTPGINNYRNAMGKIEQLTTFDRNSEEDIEIFVNIISGIIMASLDFVWGSQNHELWLRSFEHKNRVDFFIRANHFVTDHEVITLNSDLWSRVAEAIYEATNN